MRNKALWLNGLILFIFSYLINDLSSDSSKAAVSILNMNLMILPLFSILISAIYYYSSKESMEFILTNPVSRFSVVVSIYLSLIIVLSLYYSVGIVIPTIIMNGTGYMVHVLVPGYLIILIFSSVSVLSSVIFNDKVKGIAFAIFLWLFFAFVYDSLLALVIFYFSDFNLEKILIVLISLNPIDLYRINTLLFLDTSAMMGFTSAFMKNLFGTTLSIISTYVLMGVWVIIPFIVSLRLYARKSF